MHIDGKREANKQAEKLIMEKFNSSNNSNTLDLHHLHVQEAMSQTQKFISVCSYFINAFLNYFLGEGIKQFSTDFNVLHNATYYYYFHRVSVN